jgi:hypothetical protein
MRYNDTMDEKRGKKGLEKKSYFLVGLATMCLAGIGLVLLGNFLKNPPKINLQNEIGTRVLGQQTIQALMTPASENVKLLFQNTIESSKDIVKEKVNEVEQTILTNIQKEVTNLTDTQIDALKLQICKDMGVIPSASSSPTPSSN